MPTWAYYLLWQLYLCPTKDSLFPNDTHVTIYRDSR